MSFSQCINDAIAGGFVDPKKGAEADQLYLELEREFTERYGPAEGAAKAARETISRISGDKAEEARRKLLQLTTIDRVITTLAGAADPESVVPHLIEALGGGAFTGARARADALRGLAYERMHRAITGFGRDLVGRTRDKAGQFDVLRELHGEDTGNATAKALAAAWRDTSELLRVEFNRAGGAIPRLEGWAMSTYHDWDRVAGAGLDEWKSFILPRLDRERMLHHQTGTKLSDAELDRLLNNIWETIRTDGWIGREPTQTGAGASLAKRRGGHRVLHFESAAGWLEYQKRFGDGDVYNAMLTHIDSLARETALMQELGPNPNATINYVRQWLVKRAKEKPVSADREASRNAARAERSGEFLQTLTANFSGEVNRPVGTFWAPFLASVRAALSSAQLGSAVISAVTDPGLAALTARFNGGSPARLLGNYVKLAADPATRDLAIRSGLLAEHATQIGAALARHTGEIDGNEFMRRTSDAVMRTSGLSMMTQIGKWAFGMEFMSLLADNAGRAFRDLPDALRRQFEVYRIGADEWDMLRAVGVHDEKGFRMLRPDDLWSAARNDTSPARREAATRFRGMIMGETEFAVPTASLTARAMLIQRNRPGTIPGELIRSGLMYKNFPITIIMTHLKRGFSQPDLAGKASYLAGFAAVTGVLGAVALQAKEIAKGKEPRPIDDPRFWAAAFVQGGGGGIFGDFLFADTNRFGAGFGETVAGPMVSLATDLHKLTVGNVGEALEGKDMNLARDVTNFLGSYTPGGSIWYLRAFYRQAVLDQLTKALDPAADKRFRAMEQRSRKETGNGYWWHRGEALPSFAGGR